LWPGSSSSARRRRPLSQLLSYAPPPSWLAHGDESPPAVQPLHSVPRAQFQVLLTHLSVFFSTFLRSTSSLSVFVSYLGLAEIYLLICAALTSNTTLEQGVIRGSVGAPRGLSPSLVRLSYQLWLACCPPAPNSKGASRGGRYRPPASTFDLFQLPSPVLMESLLFSFPPLNNMLKFRG